MKYHRLIISAGLVTVFIAGCGRSSPDRDRVHADGAARQSEGATDERIVAFVSWLKRKGVTVEYLPHAEGDGGRLTVTEPPTSDEYDVHFYIRSFPTGTSEEQMRRFALEGNLAYVVNAPAHLAMSYAGTSGKHPDAVHPKSDDELPKVNGLPVTEAVEKLFQKYKGE